MPRRGITHEDHFKTKACAHLADPSPRLTRAGGATSKATTVRRGLPVADEPDPERLRALSERIETVKRAQAPKPRADAEMSQAQHAWRMVTELVAGLAIGFGIGYGLDAVFGTMPLFLVLFILLGFTAGVRVMLRTATEIQTKRQADPQDGDDTGERD